MPIHAYDRPRCGRFEALQKMSSPALEVHEVCGSRVTKLMGASFFAFRGSGFHATDPGARRRGPQAGAKPPCGAGGCGAGACRAAAA